MTGGWQPAEQAGRVRAALLDVSGLRVTYRGRPPVRAVQDVDLTVNAGQVVGLVGESGCGKSTLARAVCGLVKPEAGAVTFDGTPVTTLGLRRRPTELTRIQMVFQDPYASLHPRRRDRRADRRRRARRHGPG